MCIRISMKFGCSKYEDAWGSVDPLGEALHFLRMSGIFYCRSEFSAPWGLALPPMKDSLMFHFVTSGRCWLEVEERSGANCSAVISLSCPMGKVIG
jgi:hypothetical protein